MTSIDPANRLAALLGAQVAAIRERAAARPPGQAVNEASIRHKSKHSHDVASLAAKRAQAIDPDDPQRSRKAFRIFLEGVLLNELGDELINDPAFGTMIDDVHKQMEADPELASALTEAARLLLGPYPP